MLNVFRGFFCNSKDSRITESKALVDVLQAGLEKVAHTVCIYLSSRCIACLSWPRHPYRYNKCPSLSLKQRKHYNQAQQTKN